MPVLATIVGYTLIALGPLTTAGYILAYSLIAGGTLAQYEQQRRRAVRAARAAWEASLRDRTQVIRSAEMPRSLCYGWLTTSGVPVYGRTVDRGQDSERLMMILALRPEHEIDAIEEVWIGERQVGPLDANGYPVSGPFVTTRTSEQRSYAATASGGATTVINLPETPLSWPPVTAMWYAGGGSSESGSDWLWMPVLSVVGNQVTVDSINASTGSPIPSGTQIEVRYTTSISEKWIRIKKRLGTSTQTVDADVIADSGGERTSEHRGRGVPDLTLWFWYNESVYPIGLENIKALIRGKKVYDPRKDSTKGGSGSHRDDDPSTWEWSRNPALCVRDYLHNEHGYNVPNSRIDDTTVAVAANVCDERVDIYVGGSVTVTNGSNTVTGIGTNWPSQLWGNLFFGPDGQEYVIQAISGQTMTLVAPYAGATSTSSSYAIRQLRYLCDIEIPLEGNPVDGLTALLGTMAGFAVFSQGKWRIGAGVFASPVMTITEANLTSTEQISIVPRPSRADTINTVRGVYVSPQNNWQPTDYPQVTNSTYVAEDGGEEMVLDLQLPGTIDPYMAQRLAKIALERARQSVTVKLACNMSAYRVSAGDVVSVTLERYGFSAKQFRVVDREFDLAGGVLLTLREEAVGVYDWNFGEATQVDLAPNTTLPNPYESVPMPALQLASDEKYLRRLADGTLVTNLHVSWTALTDRRVIEGGSIEVQWMKFTDLQAGIWRPIEPLPGDSTSVLIGPQLESERVAVRARTRTAIGVAGDWTYSDWHVIVGKTSPPSQVSALYYSIEPFGVRLYWPAISDPDVAGYELRVGGTSWDTATPLSGTEPTRTSGTDFLWRVRSAGTYDVRIKAYDTGGRYSSASANASVAIAGPPAPTASIGLSGSSYVIEIASAGTGNFALDRFRIRRGASYGSAQIVADIYTSRFEAPASWLGAETFWITQIDVAGNESSPHQVQLTISAPGVPLSFAADVIVNLVQFRWAKPSSSLPIARYILRKGATFAGATIIGDKAGDQTFTTHQEPSGGTYTYWLSAVDSAGNEGSPASITQRVDDPSNFRLQQDWHDDFSGTKSSCALSGGKLFAPLNITETWSEHFSTRSWSTPQDQINAGYPRYFMPSSNSAVYERVFDYGTTINATLISLVLTTAVVTGSVTVTPTISISDTSASGPWTDFAGVSSVFATGFRWVKVKLDFAASGGDNLIEVSDINLRLSLKSETDAGRKSASDFSSGVCAVTFNKSFIDIDAINVTPLTTSRREVAVEFSDVPNPTGFNVRIWDPVTGNLTPTDFSWSAQGVA